MKFRTMAFIAAVTVVSPALAQQAGPTTDLSKVDGGDYVIDKNHAKLIFSYSHFGFSTSYGLFTDTDARLHFDSKSPASSKLEAAVNMNAIDTAVPKLDEHLKSAAFFDVAKYPTASFKSTKITVTGPTTGTIEGELTLHGVTKPVVLDATFNGAGTHPVKKVYDLGFNAVGHVKRSDFGLGAYAPMVGDDVTLTISAEFDQAK